MARDDDYEIAYEQYLWWRRQGLTHAEMLLAVGCLRPPVLPTSRYVVDTLALVHQRLLAELKRDAAA